MKVVHLSTRGKLLREANGATVVDVGCGRFLEISPKYLELVELLAAGVPKQEWEKMCSGDSNVATLELILSENGALETSELSGFTALKFDPAPVGGGKNELWVPVVFSVLTICIAATIALTARSASFVGDTSILTFELWAMLACAFFSIALIHEHAHAFVARTFGCEARVRLWRSGFRPQCEIRSAGAKLTRVRKSLILISGPASDGIIALLCILGLKIYGASSALTIIALVAGLAVAFNAAPLQNSDFRKILDMAQSRRARQLLGITSSAVVMILLLEIIPALFRILLSV